MDAELVIMEPFPQAFCPACGCEKVELVIVLGERAAGTPYLQLQRL
jgi:formate dehydrogenase maturation protein FdhE